MEKWKNGNHIVTACAAFALSALLASCQIETPAAKTKDLLSPAEKAEVAHLYGYYWGLEGGKKEPCIEIGDNKLISYSSVMSFSYTNIRWNKVSASEWTCASYLKTDEDYDPEDRRIVLTFKKDGGTWKLHESFVKPMNQKYRSFTKGEAPTKITEGGKDYYVYKVGDPLSIKMKAPTAR